MKLNSAILLAALATIASSSRANIIGTATVTNADHYGYFGFSSTSAHNTKANIGGFTGTARVIHITGTITGVNPDAYADGIQVQPSGTGMASYQPSWQLSNLLRINGTMSVSTNVYAPGGFDASKPIHLEMFSLDDEEFVPGLDARSTLTYSLDDSFAPGTASYSGTLSASDPTFARPIQYPIIDGEDNNGWDDPEPSFTTPHYDVQPFHVSASGEYSMVSANEYYSAGVLYAGAFDPNNPLLNCVAARDIPTNVIRNNSFAALPYLGDAVGGTKIDADLVPGVQYYYVTTAEDSPGGSTDAAVYGKYSNIITGTGNVTLGLVPEPTTALAAIAGIALLRRRRATL